MVFELVATTPEGPIEVCGGGRYDGLARVLGSERDDRGVGFAFGLERLDHAIARRGGRSRYVLLNTDLVIAERPEFLPEAIRLATRLRSAARAVILNGDQTSEEANAYAKRLGLGRILVVRGPLDRPQSIRVDDLAEARTRLVSIDDLIPRSEAR